MFGQVRGVSEGGGVRGKREVGGGKGQVCKGMGWFSSLCV